MMQQDYLEHYEQWLFPYAYNILGSADDAKDAIQDVMSSYIMLPHKEHVEDAKKYLVKSVVNRSINIKKKKQRMVSEQVTLPEPIATEQSDRDVHLNDIVSYAMLILMDELTVKERAAFVLKEAFHYAHEEIADVLGTSLENSRKLLSRAKQKLTMAAPAKEQVLKGAQKSHLQSYINAIRTGDVKALEQLFAEEITVVADGGGKVQVVRNLTEGNHACIELLLYVYEKYQQNLSIKFSEVNHQPAILYYHKDRLITCQVFTINAAHQIEKISAMLDEEKMKHISA